MKFLKSLTILGTTLAGLALIAGCVNPELFQTPDTERIRLAMEERTSLPDDYTRVLKDAKINRPVVITIHLESRIIGRKGITVPKEKESTMERNWLIRRLLATRAFRQILPNDDPADPSLPPDTLILDCQVDRTAENKIPYRGSGMMPVTNNYKFVIHDLKDIFSSTTTALARYTPYKTGQLEFIFTIDSGKPERKVFDMSKSDYFDQYLACTEGSFDRIIDSLVAKLQQKGI